MHPCTKHMRTCNSCAPTREHLQSMGRQAQNNTYSFPAGESSGDSTTTQESLPFSAPAAATAPFSAISPQFGKKLQAHRIGKKSTKPHPLDWASFIGMGEVSQFHHIKASGVPSGGICYYACAFRVRGAWPMLWGRGCGR